MSLDSMADILHCMEQEGKEFWEVVLAADMEERQVSRSPLWPRCSPHGRPW